MIIDRFDLFLNLVEGEKGEPVFVKLYDLCIPGHGQLHKILYGHIHVRIVANDLVDIRSKIIADGSNGQVTLLV